MGHFSVPCGISGLPIQHNDPIIGFNVEPVPYQDHYAYIPINIPVIGNYDDYGRLEGKEGRSQDHNPLVLCHKELWDKTTKGHNKEYKDYANRPYASLKEFFNICRNVYLSYREKYKNIDISINLDEIAQSFSYFEISKKDSEYIGPHVTFNHIFPNSKPLKKEWNSKICGAPGVTSFTDQEFTLLSQLCQVYQNISISGRQVTPTDHCFTQQDTDFKSEARWHDIVSEFANKTMKKRNRN